MAKDLKHIAKARTLIDSVRKKPLTIEERCEKSIELASLMLLEAKQTQTVEERKSQKLIGDMVEDEIGKAFTTDLTDQCFRTKNPVRVTNQIEYIIDKYGIPNFLPYFRTLGLKVFKQIGSLFPQVFAPFIKRMLRKETAQVILPGEKLQLERHMKKRLQQGVRLNLNHLGEAILGEEEAKKRLDLYVGDLQKPEVECISVKISTIYSQIHLVGFEDTLAILKNRLKVLYRASLNHVFIKKDGTKVQKFVNLDMEEYRDLDLTVALFKQILEEPEFHSYSAGIVLQSYLPDAYLIQKELTEWAMKRVANQGAPIKIRIVKGANLGLEQIEAAIRGWPQAPFTNKKDVDANYKRMLIYGCIKEHVQAAHLGIASHNLFDIAYAMLLRSENEIEPYTCFEMLEGMANPIQRVVQKLSRDILLYCPVATAEEFQNAVAYLVRRLDENTAPENFLRHQFHLMPGTKEWQTQVNLFFESAHDSSTVSYLPRRTQNRKEITASHCCQDKHFSNEPDTDFSLSQNREWAKQIVNTWKDKQIEDIPLKINGETIATKNKAKAFSPNSPKKPFYHYSLADQVHVDQALNVARDAKKIPLRERIFLLLKIAETLRNNRDTLIGVMMADTGKTLLESDVEVSEAIDFASYYAKNAEELSFLEDIEWEAKGVVLVAPPWNFPVSISAGGILAALVTGNAVIFKPAPEAVLVGFYLANLLWEAGVSYEALQFICCEDDPVGSALIQDERIDTIVLTGATATAKLFFRLRPGVDLIAETGGKNALIISSLADRDLSIKDVVQSAFGHSGQKCSACSLVICEREVYDDVHFREQLKSAAASLKVGSSWNLATKVNPLIKIPEGALLNGLTRLDAGEEWLLEPKVDPQNPYLWRPGIKIGVKPNSYSHQTEFFGPLLSIMRAEDLDHAIEIANSTSYGLTSGLHSLDEREHKVWMERIEAGNCYINRGITGAIVQRQPFGGFKESSFGHSLKAGGPNYLTQFMHAKQKTLPKGKVKVKNTIEQLEKFIPHADKELWKASICSYAFFFEHYFSKDHDPTMLQGQDNTLHYIPQKNMVIRIQKWDSLIDVFRIIAASTTVGCILEISSEIFIEGLETATIESEEAFIKRLSTRRVRLISAITQNLKDALAEHACSVIKEPVLANGRLELLHYLREVSISFDYHRYGNLGVREYERRAPIPTSLHDEGCGGCCSMSCGKEV